MRHSDDKSHELSAYKEATTSSTFSGVLWFREYEVSGGAKQILHCNDCIGAENGLMSASQKRDNCRIERAQIHIRLESCGVNEDSRIVVYTELSGLLEVSSHSCS